MRKPRDRGVSKHLTLPMAKARGFLLHRGLPRLRMQP